jgi:hypothetical protein
MAELPKILVYKALLGHLTHPFILELTSVRTLHDP